MTNQPPGGQRRTAGAGRDPAGNNPARTDPTEWHGHRIVTEDDLGEVFDADPGFAARDRLARKALRRRRRHQVVIGFLAVLVACAAALSVAIMVGWVSLPKPEAAPLPPTGCPTELFTYQAPETVTVNVYNATQAVGLATQVADALKARGFVTGIVGNRVVNREGMTALVISGPSGSDEAFTLQHQIPRTQYVRDDREDQSVDVVLGSGYTDLVAAEKIRSSDMGRLDCTRATKSPAPAG